MVLNNSSAPSESDTFSDSAPTSDEDPYSSSEGGSETAQQYHIDVSALPKPIPIIGPILGYNNKLFLTVLREKIKGGQQALNRPPTQDEAAALAFWTAKQISILSYGGPLGMSGGLWRAWATRQTFRFPFWQPNLESFQPVVWPNSRIAILRGNRAVLAWHGLRGLAYGAIGDYIGKIFLGSYSMTVSAVGELSDPRLKDFVDAVRQKGQRRLGGLPNPTTTGPTSGTQYGGANETGINTQRDDASPTSGLYDDESDSGGALGRGMVGAEMTSVEGGKTDWAKPQDMPYQSDGQLKTSPFTQSKESTQIEGRGSQDPQSDEFDDASPTGGQGVKADTAEQNGSAWERIRNSAKSGVKKDSGWRNDNREPSGQSGESAWSKLQDNIQREKRAGPTTGDSFAFSKSEEEQSLAKDEAQKEFDARVERERRGGDFNGGSGDQRRW